MLDTDTKRRIDTARDILVGKVPDPKSQVEQITIALIYKFMDDMDADAEELGGKRSFFAGAYARYGWSKLMAPGLGGHEMLNLYAEGITKMPENPGIPPLFREMFKNAYLPYRDPETLKAFLKIIDDFTYDNSERLGDAFEYLLSVLGSQGDAGQFRTPRHIIDFMVAIVDPKKNETVLDPACGTAGFLISSYKHILKANTNAKGHNTLTPDQRARLVTNFKGYDISPDMVRLSLVNLYLHGFADPHIFEYDTLTSLERWGEYADVILANPPFMSPKGGIKPHNRFGMQSKRSEVLFVDYMAEHLTPNGRAAIIVPEGIIFQSQNAYKQLRKLLVEDYLVAVVSLPAGVFQPYSGVKTSILILDKALAKQADSIAFFKVESDGFNLGAQRRAIDKNDLPQVLTELDEFLRRLRASESLEDFLPTLGAVVPKEKIVATGDCNLSGERHGIEPARALHWDVVALGQLCTKITDGSHNPPPRVDSGDLLLSSQNVFDNRLDLTTHRLVTKEDFVREDRRTRVAPGDVLLTIVGTIGRCLAVTDEMPRFVLQRSVAVLGPDRTKLIPQFLARVIQSPRIQTVLAGLARGVAQKGVYLNDIRALAIPSPPLEVQKEIVAEIEGYQKVIDGARAVLDNYRPCIPINPDWPVAELGTVCEAIVTGPFGSTLHRSDYVDDGIPVINPQNIIDGLIRPTEAKMVSPSTRDRLKEFTVLEDDIVIARRGEMGRCGIVTTGMRGWLCGTGSFVIRLKKTCLPAFAYFQITSPAIKQYLEEQAIGVTMKNLNQGILASIQMYLPPIAIQRAIVAEIEAEQALVNANRELISRFEKKIQTTLARVWGEESNPSENKVQEVE